MVAKPVRLTIAIIIGLTIAALVFLQSVSSVLTRKQPALAVQFFPINGLAQEQLASSMFLTTVTGETDIVPSAKQALDRAMKAFALEPLTPKAYALAALAENDVARKRAILDAALALNRRDLLLQGQILEADIARRDYEGTLASMDRILRVHPQQGATFFPLLVQVLERDEALPELKSLLSGESTWHASFLSFAAGQPRALPNLANLRLQNRGAAPEIDRNLILGLSKGGETDLSYRIYQRAIAGRGDAANIGQLDWATDFPPFDWQYQNEAGLRAQPSRAGDELEIFVRDGQGGILAERRLPAPEGNAVLRFSHSLEPKKQVGDARLSLRCPGDEEPFFERALNPGINSFALGNVRAKCPFVDLAIYARVWTGRETLQGNIGPLQITRQ